MLKLKKDIFSTFVFTFLGSFFLLYIVVYLLMKGFLLEHGNSGAVIDDFTILWLEIGVVFVVVSLVSFFFVQRLQKRITQETTQIQNYLEAIDAKNYDAVLKVNNYTEYLYIAVLLKNLVKRVKNREKKKN
ncbi:MAG TPA: hypothetical protein EYH11_04635 [Sulfurimonas autotrophica]|nr:hypothetical protein [Sulfurimonas autotrophica]